MQPRRSSAAEMWSTGSLLVPDVQKGATRHSGDIYSCTVLPRASHQQGAKAAAQIVSSSLF